MDASSQEAACAHAESAAAYLDGELEAGAAESFETHARACVSCAAAVREQRGLLCMLDVAFGHGSRGREMELPRDFARVVTARARTDMGGVRSRSERAFSIKLTLALAAACAVLLGASAGDSVLAPVGALARAALSGAGIFLHALLEAGEGTAVILRALAGRLVAGPGAFSALYCLLFAGALLLLLRLIRSYHRAH